MVVQPYLFFDGRCDEAIAFYKKALGAEQVMLMRFKENPDNPPAEMLPPNSADKVMHASLRIGDTEVFMSDGECGGKAKFEGVSLSLTVPDAATAEKCFTALSEGGQVRMPLAKTFFSSKFGMLADKFGVGWMIMAQK